MARGDAIVIALCGLMSCRDDDPESFGDREFRLESIEGYELIPGSDLALRFFHDGELDAWAGCNYLNGRYELSGGKLVTPGYFGQTERGCTTPLGDPYEQDAWFMEFLEADPHYELDEPRLVLSDDVVTIVFLDREVADPDRTLESSLWAVNGLIDEGFVFAGVHEDPATLELAEGTATIATPCAEGTGRYEIDGASLRLLEVAIDDPMCPADEISPMYDSHMREVLADGTLEWDIEADRLTLMRGDVGLMMRTD